MFLTTGACSEGAGDDEEEDEEFDWQVEQEVYTERSEEELSVLHKYGFGNRRSGVFARLQVRSMVKDFRQFVKL